MPSSITSSSCSSVSTYDYRMENFLTRHELARNFYDDFEFCPVYLLDKEVEENRERVERRTLVNTPASSPPPSPPKKKAIAIINPHNMTPVTLPCSQQKPLIAQQHYNHHHHYYSKAVHIIDPKTLQRVI